MSTAPPQPVRVLHVMESWRPVGSGYTSRSWDLVMAQARTAALDPRVLVSSRQQTYGAAAEVETPPELAGRVRATPPSAREQIVRRARRFDLDQRHLHAAIQRAGADEPIDLIHGHWSSSIGVAAAAVARQLGVPFVAEVRFDLAGAMMTETVRVPLPALERMLRARFERHLASADEIVAASYSLADLLRQQFPALAARLSVVPNGVDCASFGPEPEEQQLRHALGLDGKLLVGSTSTMLRYEGLDLLLHAMQQARARLPQLHAVFVGSGTQHEQLQRLAAQLGVPATFTGQVPKADVPRYLRLLDLFVIPRRAASITRYASPIKLMEAMACGVPIIGSAVGDVRALLAPDRGLLVEPGDVGALADAIVTLAANDATRHALGQRARAWATQATSWDDTARMYTDIYHQVLNRAPAQHEWHA